MSVKRPPAGHQQEEEQGVQGHETLCQGEAFMAEEKELLGHQLHVINIGLEVFAETLEQHHVPLVHVDWRPPAQGDAHLLDLLQRLQGPLPESSRGSGERAHEG